MKSKAMYVVRDDYGDFWLAFSPKKYSGKYYYTDSPEAFLLPTKGERINHWKPLTKGMRKNTRRFIVRLPL